MASAIDTANPEPSPRRGLRGRFGRSRLGRTIILCNLLGLVVIIVGSLVLSGYRDVLVRTNAEYLQSQGTLIQGLIEKFATTEEPALLPKSANS
ncbi:MAG: histidine kinase, partial [Caulobacteraceae bacterium]|nr:histidine kinase [Caulobacteraceae bacterium]